MATIDYTVRTSLPTNTEAERAILGAILLDNSAFNESAEHLKVGDFSLDSHRRIYARMVDLAESSRPVDMITLVEELDRHKELEPVGDVGYVSGLLDGVPDRPSIAHYIKIVREKALLRGLIHTATSAIARAAEQSEPAEVILDEAESAIFQLSEQRTKHFAGARDDQFSARRLRDSRRHRQGKKSVAAMGGARGRRKVHRGEVAAVWQGRVAADMNKQPSLRIVKDRTEKTMALDSVEICAGAGGQALGLGNGRLRTCRSRGN